MVPYGEPGAPGVAPNHIHSAHFTMRRWQRGHATLQTRNMRRATAEWITQQTARRSSGSGAFDIQTQHQGSVTRYKIAHVAQASIPVPNSLPALMILGGIPAPLPQQGS